MRSIYTVLILAIVVMTEGAFAAPVSINCQSAPGGYLCRQMRTIQSLMETHCSGSPCDALFAQQATAYQAFVDYYNQNIFEPPVVEYNMGVQAWTVANKICGYRWTGDASTFSATIFQGNLLLDILKEVQTGASIAQPRHCHLRID